ncbi:hypothetical protein MKW92_014865, partial [Papaver armeniacum]
MSITESVMILGQHKFKIQGEISDTGPGLEAYQSHLSVRGARVSFEPVAVLTTYLDNTCTWSEIDSKDIVLKEFMKETFEIGRDAKSGNGGDLKISISSKGIGENVFSKEIEKEIYHLKHDAKSFKGLINLKIIWCGSKRGRRDWDLITVEYDFKSTKKLKIGEAKMSVLNSRVARNLNSNLRDNPLRESYMILKIQEIGVTNSKASKFQGDFQVHDTEIWLFRRVKIHDRRGEGDLVILIDFVEGFEIHANTVIEMSSLPRTAIQ